MGLFGKKPKKREDEDELDEEEEEQPKKKKKFPKDKDFKDLGAENKKGRKEPVKPWGKKERLTVLLVFLVTILISMVLSLQSRGWKLPNLPKISLPIMSFMPFKEETIVIEGNAGDNEKAQEAILKFKQKTNALTGVYGFYVLHLNSGTSYGLYENDKFPAASLIKLPVMEAAFIGAEKGQLDLDSIYTLKESDKRPGAGTLTFQDEGYRISYRDLIALMGKQSDNSAFNIIRNKLGDTVINETISQIGMHNTSLTDNTTTPADIGIFFEDLWRHSLISKEAKNEILTDLTNTAFESWIAAGVPKQITVAHKYGSDTHVVNDAGIVYADEPFVLVIMSRGIIDGEADTIFPQLAKMIYEIESK